MVGVLEGKHLQKRSAAAAEQQQQQQRNSSSKSLSHSRKINGKKMGPNTCIPATVIASLTAA
jgi:hypothetical protein